MLRMRAAVRLSELATKWNVLRAFEGGADGDVGEEGEERLFVWGVESGGAAGAEVQLEWEGEGEVCVVEGRESVVGSGCMAANEGEGGIGIEAEVVVAGAGAGVGTVLLSDMPYVDVDVDAGNVSVVASLGLAERGVTCAHLCNAASARSKTSFGTASMWSVVGT